jgi:hypothetical protein
MRLDTVLRTQSARNDGHDAVRNAERLVELLRCRDHVVKHLPGPIVVVRRRISVDFNPADSLLGICDAELLDLAEVRESCREVACSVTDLSELVDAENTPYIFPVLCEG